MIEIRGLEREDVAFARSLTDIERWGHLDEDFQRFLDLNPGGCFVACEQSERLGIVTSTIHGDSAFLGNLIVRRDARARGVGVQLMERVIAWLDAKGVRTIELDGVLKAVETYRIMGFKDKYLSLRFMRPVAKRQRITPAQKVCRSPDISRILQYDRTRVKIDRRMFLAHLLKGHPETTYSVDRQGLSAYAVTRTRATPYVHIGPLVADNAENASILLSFICTEHAESDLTIGVPGVNTAALEAVLQSGFVHRPPSLRMYRGERVDYESSVYGIISADVG